MWPGRILDKCILKNLFVWIMSRGRHDIIILELELEFTLTFKVSKVKIMAFLHFQSKELCKYCICLWVLNLNRVWPKTKSGPWNLKWATNSTSNPHIRKSVLSRMKMFAHYSLRPCNTNFVVHILCTIIEGKWLKYLWQNRYFVYRHISHSLQ